MLLDRRFLYRALLLTPLLALACLCVFYLSNSYDALAGWYETLPGPFYRKAYWRKELFTPYTWQSGRWFCGLALMLIPVLCVVVWNAKWPPRSQWVRADKLAVGGIVLVALALGVLNAAVTQISMDEDQSAMFFGSTHPFRALSHYPVPNNHIIYNTLNALISTPATALINGKIIAILGYAGVGGVMFLWFSVWGIPRCAAVLMSILSLTIFPAWGFSGQARSYPLYLLAGWWALLLVTRYLLSDDKRHLAWYPVAVALGYGLLPTFIHLHVGLCVWVLWCCLASRKLHRAFWIAQLYAGASAFLVLLPLLTFSGLKAIAGHQWVTPMPWSDFTFPPFGPFRDYLTGYGRLGYLLGILTMLGAIGLLFRKQTRLLGGLFIALWVGCDVVVFFMRQTSFSRQMMGLFSASAAIGLIAAYRLLQGAVARWRVRWAFNAAAAVGVLTAVSVMILNYQRLNDALYLYRIRETNSRIMDFLNQLPPEASVGFTDNAFLPQILWQRAGKNAVSPEKARYLVQMEDVNPVANTDSLVGAYLNFRIYKKAR